MYRGLHGRWRTANSGERGAAQTAWKARNKTGDGALHLGVVLGVKQMTTGSTAGQIDGGDRGGGGAPVVGSVP
jgi:hypothetical protein